MYRLVRAVSAPRGRAYCYVPLAATMPASTPTVRAFNERLQAAGTEETDVLALLAEMKKANVVPDLESYKIVMDFYNRTWPERKKTVDKQRSQSPDAYDQLLARVIREHDTEHQFTKFDEAQLMEKILAEHQEKPQ